MKKPEAKNHVTLSLFNLFIYITLSKPNVCHQDLQGDFVGKSTTSLTQSKQLIETDILVMKFTDYVLNSQILFLLLFFYCISADSLHSGVVLFCGFYFDGSAIGPSRTFIISFHLLRVIIQTFIKINVQEELSTPQKWRVPVFTVQSK